MISALSLLLACTPDPRPDPEAVARGWEVLRYGDFVGAGVPADLWFDLIGTDPRNVLDRSGDSARLGRAYNLFAAQNGVEVVGGLTCFGCHAAEVEGTFYPGVGDPRIDLSSNATPALFGLVGAAIDARYGEGSPEAEAAMPFLRGGEAVGSATVTPFAGVNPAFSLERAAVAHRDPSTLEWSYGGLAFDVPEPTIWSDTPPWWHIQKRGSLYWTGFGRGDLPQLLMQISVVAVTDVDQAEQILQSFDDVVAWLLALEPPPYPGPVDSALASDGEALFVAHCSRCHGTYGAGGVYTEQVVPLAEIGTDGTYAAAFDDTPFVAWLAESWFASDGGEPPPVLGYVAPPLDGIWVTAPYLHNGSVPDLASLLDPALRPARWRRDPLDTALDHTRMGWPYTEPAPGTELDDAWVYDASVDGAGNGGHSFGEALTPAERERVLEYLKTL